MVKGDTVVLLGLLGLGAYALFKSRDVEVLGASVGGNAGAMPAGSGGTTPAAKKYQVYAAQEDGTVKETEISTVEDGVRFINENFYKNQIVSPGATLAVIDRDSKSGKATSTVSRLANGSLAKISISQPARDSSGKTALDRRIEARKAGVNV